MRELKGLEVTYVMQGLYRAGDNRQDKKRQFNDVRGYELTKPAQKGSK